MIRPCFLGSGTRHASWGTGVAGTCAGLHRPPRRLNICRGRIDDRIEASPTSRSAGFRSISRSPSRRRHRRAVIEEALDEAGLSAFGAGPHGPFVGSSSFDISVSETRYRKELTRAATALPLTLLKLRESRRSDAAAFRMARRGLTFNTACTARRQRGVVCRPADQGRSDRTRVGARRRAGQRASRLSASSGWGCSHGRRCSRSTAADGRTRVGRRPLQPRWCSRTRQRTRALPPERGGASACDTHSMSGGAGADRVHRSPTVDRTGAGGRRAVRAGEIAAVKAHGTATSSSIDDAEAAGDAARAFAIGAADVRAQATRFLRPHAGAPVGWPRLVLFYRALEARASSIATPGIGAGRPLSALSGR